MKKEYRIAHLSDLHLSPDFFPERSHYFRSILRQCRALEVDHIIITGDLTNQARRNEFEHFRSIVSEFSLLDPKKLTVVVGNHDIFGGPYHAEDVLNFPSMCKRADYDGKLKEFHEASKETFEGAQFFSAESVFPFVKLLGSVAIIGINSIAQWHPFRNPLGSNGRIDDEQMEGIRAIVKSPLLEGKRVLVAIHHHFHRMEEKGNSKLEKLWTAIEAATMKLHKKKKLLKLFRTVNVDQIVHGHVHRNSAYKRHGVRCLSAGGTMIPTDTAGQAFHLLTVQGESLRIESIPVHHLTIVQKKPNRKKILPRPAAVNE